MFVCGMIMRARKGGWQEYIYRLCMLEIAMRLLSDQSSRVFATRLFFVPQTNF
jgi:hypothetical protein